MWMGYIKTDSQNYLDIVRDLDRVAPTWQYANEVHQTKVFKDKLDAIEWVEKNYIIPMELWVIIPDKTDATLARLSLVFEEFGEAVWDDNRRMTIHNQSYVQPGYVIK